MSVADTIYNDAASLGRLRAFIGLIAGAVIAIILFFIGISKINTKNPHTQEVQATVTQLTGCATTNPKNSSYQCTIAVKYNVNGIEYNAPSFALTSEGMPYVNQMITAYYDPSNPSSLSAESADGDRTTGKIMIGASFFVVGVSYFIWWLSKRYQFFAAAEGVGTAGSLMQSMWK
jgi:hypothetical protein